jgi:hypothetical protein
MTFDMYHFIHENEIEPPLVFTVKASFIRNSVPQLKWLTDNTRGSILVLQSDQVIVYIQGIDVEYDE